MRTALPRTQVTPSFKYGDIVIVKPPGATPLFATTIDASINEVSDQFAPGVSFA
jgi:hypothetical protein